MDALLHQHASEIRRIAARHGATRVRAFGSRARDDADVHSDLDLLVDLEPGRSLFDLISLQAALEERLGCRVEVSERVSPYLRDQIEREAVVL